MSIPTTSRSVMLAGILAGLLAGCGKSEVDPRTLPPLVRVAEAGTAEGADREFTGIVGARVQAIWPFGSAARSWRGWSIRGKSSAGASR